MWSDGLTKEVDLADELKKVLMTCECDLDNKGVKKVVFGDLKLNQASKIIKLYFKIVLDGFNPTPNGNYLEPQSVAVIT